MRLYISGTEQTIAVSYILTYQYLNNLQYYILLICPPLLKFLGLSLMSIIWRHYYTLPTDKLRPHVIAPAWGFAGDISQQTGIQEIKQNRIP
jgi:tellurite resistance protein TehA-like permease